MDPAGKPDHSQAPDQLKEKPPKLACASCRRRKIKCDHRTPVCRNCLKYGQDCIWPERRRSSVPRKRIPYQNLVARLTQMECLVQQLQGNTETHSPNSTIEDDNFVGQATPGTSDSATTQQSSPASTGKRPPSSTHSGEPFFRGASSEATMGSTEGACSIFSLKGVRKINSLIGDDYFSRIIHSLETQNLRTSWQSGPSTAFSPVPSNDVVMACVNDFLSTQNRDIRLFQELEIRSAVQTYFDCGSSDESGGYIAINIILAHSIRKRNRTRNPDEYEKYLHNVMGKLSDIILKKPTPLHIGALLSTVLYFVFRCENHIAVTVLGMTVQLILLSGYHRISSKSGLAATESLHRRRLFWQAYIIDHDLMLRMGKPPLISDEFLLSLPEEHPPDGYGLYYYRHNITINFFRQQVCLAQMQGRIFSSLYTKINMLSAPELESRIIQLDKELQEWYNSIPEMIRPEPTETLVDADYSRLMCLTTLHFTYFQLIVAIHSAAFRLFAADEGNEAEEVAIPSVALCVSASRAAISLLTYHQSDHPFAIYLLYQVAWSADILFISILQNKTTHRASDDLQLIKNIVLFFEKYDPNHQSVFSYHIISALVTVASHVLQNQSGLSQGCFEQQPLRSLHSGHTILENLETLDIECNATLAIPERPLTVGSTLLSEDLNYSTGAGLADEEQWFTGLLDWHIPLDFQPEIWKDGASF